MSNRIFSFRRGAAEKPADPVEALGQKGADLAFLAGLDTPVPPGFTVSTKAWRDAEAAGEGVGQELRAEVNAAIARLQKTVGRELGGTKRPLLLAVRTSAREFIPGLAASVLNVGLNDETVETLGREMGDAAFAFRSYRKLVESYAALVLDVDPSEFEDVADAEAAERGWTGEPASAEDWRRLMRRCHEYLAEEFEAVVPQDPFEQVIRVVAAGFESWRSPVAKAHRVLRGIPEGAGLAVTVHRMVLNERSIASGRGQALSRDLETGEAKLGGEFLCGPRQEGAIGEKPPAIDLSAAGTGGDGAPAYPGRINELRTHVEAVERALRDAAEVDFMLEEGELYLMQARRARRSAAGAMRMAIQLVDEGTIEAEEAILRIDPASLDQLLHPTIAPSAEVSVLARGMPASPGAAAGEIVFSAERAQRLANEERPVILVRTETYPEDIHGMHAAEGVLTIRGGTTSHAAVVARGIGKPCVTGAGTLRIDLVNKSLIAAGRTLKEGDEITIDGTSGEVIAGRVPLERPSLSGDFATLLTMADGIKRMGVRTNAETPAEARAALSFGAEGIGLCRTEHMFFDGERVKAMREMILATDEAGRRAALDGLLPIQRSDFVELFTIMAGAPVTIRLLDPPLHEFLPKSASEIAETALMLGVEERVVRERIAGLEEFNPMLGHRGCRLAISYPEIAETQARAIFEAALEAGEATGAAVVPEIMVPLVSLRRELDFVRERIERVARDVMAERGRDIAYLVGTMIELPRAAIRADAIAEVAEFLSFGTNDLTQTVYGISRDDAGNFLSTYVRQGIFDRDPFQTVDVEGVGELIALAVERARRSRPDISLGVCGEQGGDPASIAFFERTGLDYVSCSPFRVPIARLASAQAAIRGRKPKGGARAGRPAKAAQAT